MISDSGDDVEVIDKKDEDINFVVYHDYTNYFFSDVNQHDVMAAISDQIKRARAISDIDSESFVPQVI